MSYKRYPRYKNSGVEWIGEVPEHWQLSRLRHVARFTNSNVDKKSYEGQEAVRLCNYTDVYNHEFITSSLPFMQATASTDEIAQFALKRGDVLMTKDSEDPSDIGVPALVEEDMQDVICGYHLTVVRSEPASGGAFLHRSLQSHATKAYFCVESPGITRYGLSQDAIGSTPVCLPPKTFERNAIVDWINRETSRIDALIAKKTQFIELLNEMRQALIAHAVTKGLDPNVRMKDSGVEWIGQVPVHWDTAQLGKVTLSRCDGPFGSGLKSEHYVADGVRVVRLQNIGSDEFKASDQAFISEKHWKHVLGAGHDVRAGDVLIAGLGDENNPLGRACVAPDDLGDAMVKADCYRFRLGPRLLPSYAARLLSATARAECGYLATGATRDRLNLGLAASRVVLLPPPHEQQSIIDALDARQARIDMLSTKTLASIDFLKERRAALITAAVTGQIDLREAA